MPLHPSDPDYDANEPTAEATPENQQGNAMTTTDPLTVTGRAGETLSAYAYSNHVTLEIAEGDEMLTAHLSIAALDQHIVQCMALRAAALLMGGAWVVPVECRA